MNDIQYTAATQPVDAVYKTEATPSQQDMEKAWRLMCDLLSGKFKRLEIEIATGKKDQLFMAGMGRVK